MAKLITVNEAFKMLEKAGFSRRNQVGSHVTYTKNDKRITLVSHGLAKEVLCPRARKQLKEVLK